MFILGIDGGGTHTRLELRTCSNELICRRETGAFNMAALGEDGFRARLREIFDLCGSMVECAAICLGGAGVSGGAMEPILRQELQRAGFHGALRLCGDHEIALAGAMEGPGCILISGTGSICCGRDAAGRIARAGGMGHLIDDGGSGYRLGQQALALTAKVLDGREPPGMLSDAVLRRIGGTSREDLVRFTYYSASGKSHIAQISKVVIACAEAGDMRSLAVLEDGAEELKSLLCSVSEKLGLDQPKTALMGGLLEPDWIYGRIVKEKLRAIAEITPPEADALRGASRLAFGLLGNDE